MIKMLAVIGIMVLTINSSLANTQDSQRLTEFIRTGVFAQTVTPKGPVPVRRTIKVLIIPKPKIFRSNPLRKSQILGGTDPSQAVDDEDYIFARNRNKIQIEKLKAHDDLPEHIRWRLFMARTAALLIHKTKYG